MNIKKLILAIICTILCTALCIYNAYYINPKQLKVRTETIISSKIDPSLDGTLIVYFSDLYYEDENRLKLLSDLINNADPDVVVFGGDLLKQNDSDTVIKYLKSINSHYGKYAVYGENDYKNIDTVNRIYKESDFEILCNRGIRIFNENGAYFNLVGLDSLSNNQNYAAAFDGISNIYYTFVIAHEPDSFDKISYSFDYMLSGHSLGGEVYIPLINVFNRPFGAINYYHGKSGNSNKMLDITNGVGLKEKSARFMADAEIVFYQLRSH